MQVRYCEMWHHWCISWSQDADDDEVHMILETAIARVVTKLRPNAQRLLTPNGTLVVRLRRALCRYVQSSKLWYDKLCLVLHDSCAMFGMNAYDPCVCIQPISERVQITVCFHVDDLLIKGMEGHLRKSQPSDSREETCIHFCQRLSSVARCPSLLTCRGMLKSAWMTVCWWKRWQLTVGQCR